MKGEFMGQRVMKLPEVMRKTGLSKSSIYAYKNKGLFPCPINIGPRSVGWIEEDISNWIERKRDGVEI
ncbi:helix-turn-helix transcriptional regulator [Roseivirga pacifica]|uniref:helix-turn-helix transcriptional regulator n=1 Tax=Roseivirga pacifica TaxID=1267423 RepID=UPI003BAD9E96